MKHTRNSFRVKSVYRFKQPNVIAYASNRLSFVIAMLSLVAFVAGNTLGYLGWHGMWKTVFGKEDDTLIVFTGTVSPVQYVPDYTKWSKFGGDANAHTYDQVPMDLRVPTPAYDPLALSKVRDATQQQSLAQRIYTTPYLGDYATQRETYGSHPGVDLDVPWRTPILSIANGIVEKVSEQPNGFGKYLMIRHPNVPDPDHPTKTTTIWSIYAHLDDIAVAEGQVVRKGQRIGLSGKTGFVMGASGFHLYFQIDKATAPWHPYWPFTNDELRAAGISYVQAINTAFHQERIGQNTVSPMLFVQQYQSFTASTQIATSAVQSADLLAQSSSALSSAQRAQLIRQQRIAARLAQTDLRMRAQTALALATPEELAAQAVSSAPATSSVTASVASVIVPASRPVVPQAVKIVITPTSPTFTRSRQQLSVRVVDANGDTVANPVFSGAFTFTTAFGDALFQPGKIYQSDFFSGKATVDWTPGPGNGKKTIIISAVGPLPVENTPPIAAGK